MTAKRLSKSSTGRRRPRGQALAVALLAAAALCQSCFFQGDPVRQEHAEKDLNLAGYRLSHPPIVLDHQVGNASGLTFNRERGTLLLIQNGPTRVLELTRDGKVLRAIELTGFEDTEDIAHLGGTRYAVVEERRRSVALIDIAADTVAVDHDAVPSFLVEPETTGNKGLEGLTFNPLTGEYFATREKKPRRIYRFGLPDRSGPVKTETPWNAQWHSNGLHDLSAIHIDSDSGRLLLLSDESKALVEVNASGKEISRLRLENGYGGLVADVPQAEGITMDDRKMLYVCSEPNLLYIFAPAGG